MKRGRILDISDCCVHVTHRCHNRDFLLKFGLDRRSYVPRLRETVKRFDVGVLDHVVTSNDVHLLLRACRVDDVSRAMQYLQGLVARDCNRRKKRSGAFWSDRFKPTLVQNGSHLCRCLFYIGLNMVRAGAVEHPAEWAACGYHELTGRCQRYRIVDVPLLLNCLEMPEQSAHFLEWYERTMQTMCESGYLCREPLWSEAAAVGSRAWIESLSGTVVTGRREIVPMGFGNSDVVPAVEEGAGSYALKLSPKRRQMLWRP
ncbi:MAG: transposase [Candidatus Pacebacteria bacterium]|nr:transposase [Candidatus Paceibacterota bacterium]